jgi:hypothetical protein
VSKLHRGAAQADSNSSSNRATARATSRGLGRWRWHLCTQLCFLPCLNTWCLISVPSGNRAAGCCCRRTYRKAAAPPRPIPTTVPSMMCLQEGLHAFPTHPGRRQQHGGSSAAGSSQPNDTATRRAVAALSPQFDALCQRCSSAAPPHLAAMAGGERRQNLCFGSLHSWPQSLWALFNHNARAATSNFRAVHRAVLCHSESPNSPSAQRSAFSDTRCRPSQPQPAHVRRHSHNSASRGVASAAPRRGPLARRNARMPTRWLPAAEERCSASSQWRGHRCSAAQLRRSADLLAGPYCA